MGTERSTRIWRFGTVIIVFLAVVLVGCGGAYLAVANSELRAQLSASQANAQDLYEQLLDEGVTPEGDAPAEVVPGPAGAQGERGPRGFDGQDGKSVIGPRGPAGVDGTDGADGESVTGPQGPAGESVVGPQGPAGPTGPAGKDGKDGATGPQGVGIATVTCQENGDWIFTLTDQTTITVPGPCRVDPIIEGATP